MYINDSGIFFWSKLMIFMGVTDNAGVCLSQLKTNIVKCFSNLYSLSDSFSNETKTSEKKYQLPSGL